MKFHYTLFTVIVCCGLYTMQPMLASDDVKELWDKLKEAEPTLLLLHHITWYATGSKNSALTSEQQLVWQRECKTVLGNSYGTLKPADVNELAQPWWTRGRRLGALADAIKLASRQKTTITPEEFDRINQLPHAIRKAIQCPAQVNVQNSTKKNYRDIALTTGKAFAGGALIGALIGMKSAQGSSNGNQKILTTAGGFGFGAAFMIGIPAAYKAYEESKISKPMVRTFDKK
jgi:hypothetical protein